MFQVNIPDIIRSKVTLEINQTQNTTNQGLHASRDIFDKAQTEIFNLMSTDSFRRFVKEEATVELSDVQRSTEVSMVSINSPQRDEENSFFMGSNEEKSRTLTYGSSSRTGYTPPATIISPEKESEQNEHSANHELAPVEEVDSPKAQESPRSNEQNLQPEFNVL